MDMSMRLEKFLAECGIASRRNAKKYIQAGRVTVNDEREWVPGRHIVAETDIIKFDGNRVEGKSQKIYLMLNKPVGYLTTRRDERDRPTVMELVRDVPQSIYPVGRLDFDTTGLLLMTNDGTFAYRLTHPSHEVEKTYIAQVERQPSQRAIQQLRNGIKIVGGCTAPAIVVQIGRKGELTQFKLVIHEGKKRQIRRMFRAVGHKVIELKRVQIGNLQLGDLALGEYRMLTLAEIEALRN
jgi:pseudouridine synthase